MTVEPNVKYQFTEPFRTAVELLLQGRNPTTPEQIQRQRMNEANPRQRSTPERPAGPTRPPSIKQLALLKKLGVDIVPNTMSEASMLIDRALNKPKSA